MSEKKSLEGSRVPNAELAQLDDGKVRRFDSEQLFRGRRVSIDDVVCLSVNDPYVMEAWQRSEKAQGIHFVADSFAEFTRAMGMDVDNRDALLGTRSWRYSMLVEDGVVRKMFIEPDVPGDPFEVSDADTMMKFVNPNQRSIGPVMMLARHGCGYCKRAKELLARHGVPFEAVHLGDELTMQGVKAASGVAKVPQIFVDGKLIGGAEQLERFLAEK
jgi:glutathione-dependent peroxiredoxin